jgi:hypothetical protein
MIFLYGLFLWILFLLNAHEKLQLKSIFVFKPINKPGSFLCHGLYFLPFFIYFHTPSLNSSIPLQLKKFLLGLQRTSIYGQSFFK